MRTTFAAALSALLLALLVPLSSQAQHHPGGFTVENFSVYSSLPDPSGNRHVAISFRVVNHSILPLAIPKAALVMVGQTPRRIAFPNLPQGGTAFISDVFATKDASIAIAISIVDNSVVTTAATVPHATVPPAISYTAQLDHPEPNRWQSLGPSKILSSSNAVIGVGRVTTIVVDPRSENIVYVGARGSGIWKTTDAGGNWFPISDSLPSVHMDSLAIDPSNPERVLAASPAGVFQSLDAGTTWTQLTSQDLKPWGADGATFLVGPGPNPPLYLSTLDGLQVSTDGGTMWNLVLGNPALHTPIGSLQMDTSTPTTIYASLSSPNPPSSAAGVGAYIGLNGGLTSASWHQLQGCPQQPLPSFPVSSRVWIAQSGLDYWVSFLAGSADGSVRQLWHTTNSACQSTGFFERHWVQVPIASSCDQLSKDNSSFLFMHPDSSSIVFKAGRPLCRTSNGGSPEKISSLHDDQHYITVAPSNHQVMYLGNDGGIYRSNDSGASWTFVGEGLAVSEELSEDTGTGSPFLITGTQDNGSAKWDGFSPVWNSLDNASPIGDKSLVVFDRSNANLTYQIGQGMPDDIQSYNNTSFQALGDSSKLPSLSCYDETPSISCGLATTGLSTPIVIAGAGLWIGSPWQQLVPSVGTAFNRVKSRPNDIFLAGTTDGRVFGGGNLSSLTPLLQTNPAATISSFAYSSEFTYFVSTSTTYGSGRLYRLTCPTPAPDAPLACTPVDISPNLPNGEITSILVVPGTIDNLLVSMRAAGLFRGVPTGSANTLTWTPFNNGLPDGVTITNIGSISSKAVFLSTFGRGTFGMFPPVPGNPSVTGHVRDFTQERLNPGKPPGPLNPLLSTVTMDTSPVSLFSATNLAGSAATILRNAVGTTRLVSITYKPLSATSGTILSVH
jgi:photosystem II stability/assembly factor-like uncharacterized protein